MKKFLVTADLDYADGHLEGIVEAESEEVLKEMMKKENFARHLDVVVDDYGDIGEYEYEEVES